MRTRICGIVAILMATGLAPAQQPAAAQATVLIAPFKAIAQTANIEWIGQGIQQNLLNELSRLRHATAVLARDQGVFVTPEEAIKAGKNAGAGYVLFGSYQLSEGELRITAQLMNVTTGKSLGGLKATGALRDLFALEDSLADQLKRMLAAELQPARPQPAPQAGGPGIQPNGPLRDPQDARADDLINRARDRYDTPDYWRDRYNYGYPYYGYPGYYGYGWRGYFSPVYFPPMSVPHGLGRDPRLGFGNSVGYYQMTLTPPKR